MHGFHSLIHRNMRRMFQPECTHSRMNHRSRFRRPKWQRKKIIDIYDLYCGAMYSISLYKSIETKHNDFKKLYYAHSN